MRFIRNALTTYRWFTLTLFVGGIVVGMYWWFMSPTPGPIEIFTVHDVDTPKLDVVFVHGLEGHWHETWQNPKAPEFWPEELGRTRKNIRVYSIGYNASSTNWVSEAMSIQDRGRNILELLVAHRLGDHPIIFVTHSLGGLVTKSALRSASDGSNTQWRKILNQTRMVVFFATPHSGSNVADYIKNAEKFGFTFRSGELVDQLKNNSRDLRDLNYWYRINAPKRAIETVSYVEAFSTSHVTVVDETQGDPGITDVIPIKLDADHRSICKLTKTSLAYMRVGQFVDDTLTFVGEGPNGRWQRIDVTQPDASLACVANTLITNDTLRGPIDASMQKKITDARTEKGYTNPVADRIAFASPILFPGAMSIQFPATSDVQLVVWLLARDKQGCRVLHRSIDASNGSPVKLDWDNLSSPVQCILFAFPLSEEGHRNLNHPYLRVQPNVSL